MNEKNKFAIIAMMLATISLTMSLSTCNFDKTKYATITGENFNIPKIEGNGYFERGEDL